MCFAIGLKCMAIVQIMQLLDAMSSNTDNSLRGMHVYSQLAHTYVAKFESSAKSEMAMISVCLYRLAQFHLLP